MVIQGLSWHGKASATSWTDSRSCTVCLLGTTNGKIPTYILLGTFSEMPLVGSTKSLLHHDHFQFVVIFSSSISQL